MKKKTTRPVCGRCHHPGFRLLKADDGRPRFTCDKCGNTWTCGLSGGEYLAHAMKEKTLTPQNVPQTDNYDGSGVPGYKPVGR